MIRNVVKRSFIDAEPILATWSPACQVMGFHPSIIRRPIPPVAQFHLRYWAKLEDVAMSSVIAVEVRTEG